MKMFNLIQMKENFYTTSYFHKTKAILLKDNNIRNATMQFKTFSKQPYMVCGVSESIAILEACLTPEEFAQLTIYYRPDGSIVQPKQCVLSISGPYPIFCVFENIIDGILARRSSTATNCWEVLKLITPAQLLFMADRSDDYQLHPYDGYAAYTAGVRKFSNDSHIALISQNDTQVVGTMPHALIQQYGGDIVAALKAYLKCDSKNVTVLIDFENDILKTITQLIPYFKQITGIRIDTSKSVIDKSLVNLPNAKTLNGVNPLLVKKARALLDQHGGQHIKIIVSSGLDLAAIKGFIDDGNLVDGYGIGSSLIRLCLHFTADLVKLDGKPLAKFGRAYISEADMVLYGK